MESFLKVDNVDMNFDCGGFHRQQNYLLAETEFEVIQYDKYSADIQPFIRFSCFSECFQTIIKFNVRSSGAFVFVSLTI